MLDWILKRDCNNSIKGIGELPRLMRKKEKRIWELDTLESQNQSIATSFWGWET